MTGYFQYQLTADARCASYGCIDADEQTRPRAPRKFHSLCRSQITRRAAAQGKRLCMTASDVLVEKLIDWGVEFVFGLPGDGINGIMEALRQKQDKIRFIQVRHEESAAFMACGYAKMTGKIGVCLATSG
ncbi:MAG TPA: thiamine pyrophosphate-binding protein, partial [Terriglobales bacterium]|nr:thiamine pyrophosphate-binding protein [Terriglobales bacterium]